MHTVIETPLFSKLWPRYWLEEERGAFAAFLADNPEAGDVIQGSGGLRKVRWSRSGSGKSSGVRVIYFTRNAAGEIVLLVLYAKSERDSMTAKQLLEIKHALDL
ncbi:MAG: type II toxin-antitoxin system RelE/ParE family toxin [Rhodocyclaceae bacterium]|nr:type II toxin-antitoxin system RelE/ParE family toxin [Rhodocyclaceae bacterium]